MMVVVDGKQLFGYGALDRPSIVYSVRKSILAMLYGRYVDSGVIDLDRTLGELGIDDTGGLLPVERRRGCGTCWHRARACTTRPPIPATMPTMPRAQEPGSYFLYNNWDFNAAGTAFEMATGQDIYAAFARDIAAPLHMEDFQLSSQHKHPNASRSVHPPYHFLLSTRDMSRLGQLMLQQGRWDGQQLIPQDWVDAMLRPVTPAAQMHPPRTAGGPGLRAALVGAGRAAFLAAGWRLHGVGLLRPVHSRGARTPDGHRPQAGREARRRRRRQGPARRIPGAGAHVRRRGLPMIGKRFAAGACVVMRRRSMTHADPAPEEGMR